MPGGKVTEPEGHGDVGGGGAGVGWEGRFGGLGLPKQVLPLRYISLQV